MPTQHQHKCRHIKYRFDQVLNWSCANKSVWAKYSTRNAFKSRKIYFWNIRIIAQIARRFSFAFHSTVFLFIAKIEILLHQMTSVITTLGWLFIKAIESDVSHSSYVNTSGRKIQPSYSISIQFSDIVWSDDPFISSYSLLAIKVCYWPMSFTTRESQTRS